MLEQTSKKRLRKKQVQQLVLETIQLAGVLSAALVAPNAIGAMAKLGILPTKRQKDSLNQARNQLIKQGLLVKNKQGLLRITPHGQKILNLMQMKLNGLPKPKRWDDRWRMLIFDIPEYRGAVRRKLRSSLYSVGFVQIQRSVWIYPYNCEDFVALLKADLKIGKDMRYLIVDTLEGDHEYRKLFNLKTRTT